MLIHKNFVGGNILVKEIVGNTVYLENELRDTTIDWFYWAFCIEGAEGKTLTFKMQKNRVGYFGPAVSHDLKEWHWLDDCNGEEFTYTFGENESKVYFAHDMLYHPDRFFEFAEKKGLKTETLCTSRKGRQTPCITFGNGELSIILTARHHACEATGSYVLEGVLDELTTAPIDSCTVFCVPFVDYDGVVDGDQGKSREPHDQNRDYGTNEKSIYAETKSIRDYADKKGCNLAFDFHSPWHKNGRNDRVFIVQTLPEKVERLNQFGNIFESQITPNAMEYKKSNDIAPFEEWNKPSAQIWRNMTDRPECDLAFTLETAYFGTPENTVSQARLVEMGRCFARSIKQYIKERNL